MIVALCVIAAGLAGWYVAAGFGRTTPTPDVIARTQAEAERVLAKSGLTLEVREEAFSEDVPAGRIISTDPVPGEGVREQGTVGPYESDPQIEEAVKDWSRVWLLEGCRIALDLFEGRSDFGWSFLSPPWQYRPGTGCGEYETGVDFMIFKNGVPTGVAVPDLALAIADEVENQALEHKHWTIAATQVD